MTNEQQRHLTRRIIELCKKEEVRLPAKFDGRGQKNYTTPGSGIILRWKFQEGIQI